MLVTVEVRVMRTLRVKESTRYEMARLPASFLISWASVETREDRKLFNRSLFRALGEFPAGGQWRSFARFDRVRSAA